MAGIDVGDFVGQNTGKFAFLFNKVYQPLIDIDIASRGCKGIDSGTVDDEEPEFKRGFR